MGYLMSRLYGNLPLRNKLIIWFFIISFVTVLPVGIFSFVSSSNKVIQDEIDEKNIMLDVISENVYQLIHDSELAAITVAHDHEIIQALNKDSNINETQMNFLMTKFLYIIDTGTNLHYINVFDKNDRVYANISDKVLIEKTVQQYLSLKHKILSVNHGIWGVPIIKANNTVILPHFRRIKDYAAGELMGAAAIGINHDEILNCIEKYVRSNEDIVILSEDGLTLSSNNIHRIGRKFDEYYSMERDRISNGYFEGKYLGKDCFAVYHTDSRTGLTFVSIIDKEDMMAGPNSIIVITVFVMVIAILLGILIALFVSLSIAKPIKKLVSIMDKADEIDVNYSFIPKYNDEIGRLAKSFIQMTIRLKKSMDKALDEEHRRRVAEYNALKLQINPHFLYNTLSTITWLADKGYKEQIIEVTESLSTLFRIGVSKNKELITIGEEVEHVQSYLKIQQFRYQDKFKYILDIHPDILELYTVKIILQPLVENAVYHGVKELNTMGLIRITGRKENDNVILNVIDNAGKMSQAEADKLNKYLSHIDYNDLDFGIGVRNVHDRIRHHFPGNYGLEYRVEKGLTIARVCIPVVEDPIKHNKLS